MFRKDICIKLSRRLVMRRTAMFLCVVIITAFSSCSTHEDYTEPLDMFTTRLTENGTGLVRVVQASAFSVTKPNSLEEISQYMRWRATDTGAADVRWLDCNAYLSESEKQTLIKALPNVMFNTDTVWPANLPTELNPNAIMEAGKNPGLGVRSLHDKGITGKGVSIAIIDQPLLSNHIEYKENLALYEEIHVMPTQYASMHGSGVSSIAVGKNCGVAPDAKLYYWAVNLIKDPSIQTDSYADNFIAFEHGLAAAVDRMLEINEQLPEGEKIRVLSISRGFSNLEDEGVQAFLAAVERAKAAGIFVITTSTSHYYDFINQATDFGGLGKEDYVGDPDDLSIYTLGTWEQMNADSFKDKLLVPMDARTTADFTGEEDYVFYSDGGYSWVAPYLAGLYALAVQVNSDITPDEFWKTALDTASELTVNIHSTETIANGLEGNPYTLSHVINPKALIDALQ